MAHRFSFAALGGCALLLSGFSQAQDPAPAPAQQAVAVPFLYQINGNGASAYLYGTVHLPDKRVVTLPGSVEDAFDSCDSFFAEIEATPESETKVQKLATMPKGQTLDVLVGPETWSRIEARFIKAGQPAMMAKMMVSFEPWAFSSLLPMLDYLEAMATQPALDKMLYMRAEAAGKSVAGLETVEEQVAVFETFTREEQIQMLRDSLDMLEQYEASGRVVMEEMIAAWMSGDNKTLVGLLDDGFGNDPLIRERAEQELLWKRNVRFAGRMDSIMREAPAKTSFFAIGALHLPDGPPVDAAAVNAGAAAKGAPKLGVVELMRQRGYTVTRVGAKAPAEAVK